MPEEMGEEKQKCPAFAGHTYISSAHGFIKCAWLRLSEFLLPLLEVEKF